MRTSVCAIVAAIGLAAHPAFAQANRTAMKFWNGVQVTCNVTAAKAPTELGQRIAQTAIDEFTRFGGHQIDSDGRLFHFGLTEAEHEEDDGGNPLALYGPLPPSSCAWPRVCPIRICEKSCVRPLCAPPSSIPHGRQPSSVT